MFYNTNDYLCLQGNFAKLLWGKIATDPNKGFFKFVISVLINKKLHYKL